MIDLITKRGRSGIKADELMRIRGYIAGKWKKKWPQDPQKQEVGDLFHSIQFNQRKYQ